MDLPLAATRARLSQAMDLHAAGALEAAEQAYLEVLAAGYRPGEVLALLAGLAQNDGRLELALQRWRDTAALTPETAAPVSAAGGVLLQLGRYEEAAEAFQKASALDPADPLIVANLGMALFRLGRASEAIVALRRAVQAWPDDVFLQHRVRRATAVATPYWHIPMLNDAPRNAAFEAAIRRAVAKRGGQAQVLDIGAGSGLLAMMAARAGAERVVSCEIVPVVAETARAIVAANGYADRVSIVAAGSNELQVGRDLPDRADILVAEILSSDVLAEGVLASFEDAIARLAKPDAMIIPQAVTAVGCLVGGEELAKQAFVRDAAGFDVSAFGALSTNRLPVYGDEPAWERLSDDFDMVRFDLTEPDHPPFAEKREIVATGEGVAVGVLQWMAVELDSETLLQTRPEGAQSRGWAQIVHTFPTPVPVSPGQRLQLILGHDRDSLVVWPAGS